MSLPAIFVPRTRDIEKASSPAIYFSTPMTMILWVNDVPVLLHIDFIGEWISWILAIPTGPLGSSRDDYHPQSALQCGFNKVT